MWSGALKSASLRKAPLVQSSFIPPRQVTIDDAASFIGTTPSAIRHYHEVGLLSEPERGSSDDCRRYGYDEMIRLMWIRKMVNAGIALNDIRDAFTDKAPTDADNDHDVVGRTRGSRMELLSDLVTSRLEALPKGSIRPAELDSLLVIEWIFGPFGAAVNAARYIALANHPHLREESDRVDAAEEALDDTIAVDDPRVAQTAAKRHSFELALQSVMEDPALAQDDEALFDSWNALHPASADDREGDTRQDRGGWQGSMSVAEAVGRMPYDFSPARLRCMELTEEMAVHY